jgi:hypothetical protein
MRTRGHRGLRKSDDTISGGGVSLWHGRPARDLAQPGARTRRPCHNASLTAHVNSTESRALKLPKKPRLRVRECQCPQLNITSTDHAGRAGARPYLRGSITRQIADTPTRLPSYLSNNRFPFSIRTSRTDRSICSLFQAERSFSIKGTATI